MILFLEGRHWTTNDRVLRRTVNRTGGLKLVRRPTKLCYQAFVEGLRCLYQAPMVHQVPARCWRFPKWGLPDIWLHRGSSPGCSQSHLLCCFWAWTPLLKLWYLWWVWAELLGCLRMVKLCGLRNHRTTRQSTHWHVHHTQMDVYSTFFIKYHMGKITL